MKCLCVSLILWRALSGCYGDTSHAKTSALWWLLSVSFQVGNVPSGSVFSNIGLAYGVTVNPMFAGTSPIGSADVSVIKSVQDVGLPPDTFPSRVRFSSLVYHLSSTTLDAVDVTLTDGSQYFDVHFGDGFIGPSLGSPGFTVTDDRIMDWNQDPLLMTDTMNLSYQASPNIDLPAGITYLTSQVSYSHYSGGPLVTVDSNSICVEKMVHVKENIVYQYGFVVLGLVVGLIAGALIVILILFILYKVKRRTPFDGGVRPESAIDTKSENYISKSSGLVTNSKVAMKKGYNGLVNLGQGMYDGSIIYMLSMKDKLKALRALDGMDIGGTSRVDQQLENEHNKAMTDATKMLLLSLMKNGDITSGVRDKALSNFQKKVDKLDKDLNDDFKKDMEALLKTLSVKNKEKFGDLMDKQEEEKETLKEKTKHLNQQERNDLMDLLKKQHETERNELNHQLELEQKEQLEKLRKERVIRKRMGIKTLQQELLDDIKVEAKLRPEQAEWLIKEHMKNQAAIDRMYDEERSRQRMILEEKLELRRALTENKDLQEEADSELLNQMAEQNISLIVKAKKSNVLSKLEANAMIEETQNNILKTKERLDSDRERQEANLHKKLSERKRAKMEELLKTQKQEVVTREKAHAQTQTGTDYIDPLATLQGQQMMMSQHRSELTELENKIDREDVEEFGQLRDQFFNQMKDELTQQKKGVTKDLENQGMSDGAIKKILARHAEEQESLVTQQDQWRQEQSARLKKQLMERRAEWQQRRLDETAEQDNLREHEDNVIRKLMDNQVALSEVERDRIMQEHEKQMVSLENSLTLNKLQHQRMLEEKLARKRSQQLDKLQKKHVKEAKKLAREDDEEEGSELDMLKRQAEDRIAVIRGDSLQLDDELDEIRGAMMKERANALKEQEVKLGAMLAQLQMDKAKAMAQIEEQQKAIYNLKSSLMDDLHEKGMLSDPACQKVLEKHQKDQDKLNKKLDAQRARQEKELKERLQARLRQKEEHLKQLQQQELKEAAQTMSGSRPAAKLRQAALATRHMLDMEKFRNRMENEISQSLQEMKRQNELRRIEALQQQEILFINGLVRLGKFKVEELHNVLLLLFPNKSESERQTLLNNLMEGMTQEKKGKRSADETGHEGENTLEQRVLANTMAKVEHQTTSGPLKGKKKLRKRATLMDDYGDNYHEMRPDPIGRYSPEGYNDNYGDNRPSRTLPSKLPPLEKPKKKKKVMMSQEANF